MNTQYIAYTGAYMTSITARSAEAFTCPEDKKQAFLWDGELRGFGLRCTASGSKSWVVQYRIGRKERRVTIGKYPAMKAAEARRKAMKALADASSGVDLADEKTRRKHSWQDLWLWFDETVLAEKSPGYRHSCRNNWELHLKPLIGTSSVAATTYADVENVKRKLGQRTTTNRCLALMSTMANRAIRLGWTDRNPVRGVSRLKEKPRRRYLSSEELKLIWDGCAGSPAEDAIKLLLLTGARVSELLSAKWSDFDLGNGIWHKPDTKSGEDVSIPLNETAVEILNGRCMVSVWVFPNPSKTGPQKSIRRQWMKLIKEIGLVNFRLHDLRHSHASMLVNAGYGLHDIGALLGHKSQRTTARYAHLTVDRLRGATNEIGSQVLEKTARKT